MWNKPRSETEALQAVIGVIRERMPRTWLLRQGESKSPLTFDCTLALERPEIGRTEIQVEYRRQLDPRDVLTLAHQVHQRTRFPILIAAPYLGLRTRELLESQGLNYADSTGNIRIQIEQDGIFVLTQGAAKNPVSEPRALKTLKGSRAGRVVRALCDFVPPFGVRDLAERSQNSPASVSRVVELLNREALLEREGRGQIERVDWQGILRRWTLDYSWSGANTSYQWLAARGVETAIRSLSGVSLKYSVTGSAAGSRRAPLAGVRLLTVYAESPQELGEQLGLRRAEAGANVIIAEPFDPVVFERTWTDSGIVFAALSQVAADLLTGPGRSPAEGEELIEWMKVNESSWRTR